MGWVESGSLSGFVPGCLGAENLLELDICWLWHLQNPSFKICHFIRDDFSKFSVDHFHPSSIDLIREILVFLHEFKNEVAPPALV